MELSPMGMEQIVAFPKSKPPSWATVARFLAEYDFPVSLRMIDGQLAFPEETLPESWNEIRLGTPLGMVTVRRDGERLILVVWGNADASLCQAWNALVWGFAAAGEGRVETADGPRSPADYRRTADLPAALKPTAGGGS
jgi:hypothetical protein